MPKQFRLSRAQFELLQRAKSRRINGTYFSLILYIGQVPILGPKVGFVVPKKIVPRANTRNKIERRGREIMRSLLKNKVMKNTLVFQAKKGVADASYEDLHKDMTSLFEQTTGIQ